MIASTAAALLVAAPAGAATPTGEKLHYAALGASYAAGLGAGKTGDCSRSDGSYAKLWAAKNSDVVELKHAACAGAMIGASGDGAKVNSVWGAQLGAVDENTELITLTVGSNDVGTTSGGYVMGALSACISSPSGCGKSISAIIDQANESAFSDKVDALLSELKRKAPKAVIAVVGYVAPFEEDATCSRYPGFDANARHTANSLVTTLNSVMKAKVEKAGGVFVSVDEAFAGHRLCSDKPWLGGKSAASPQAALHPTAEGQRAYLAELEKVSQVSTLLAAHRGTTGGDTTPGNGKSSTSAAAGSGLAVTGTSVGLMVGVGLLVVAGGVAMVVATRRRKLRMVVR